MLRQKLTNLFESGNNLKSITAFVRHRYADALIAETSFLPEDSNLSRRLFHFMNETEECGHCKICGKETKYTTYSEGYDVYCTSKCSKHDPELIKEAERKRILTCLKKYGVDSYLESVDGRKITTENFKKKYRDETLRKELQDKKEATCLERYGENYKDIFMNRYETTCLERYGVKTSLKNPEILNKAIKTNLERYGVEFQLQSPVIQKKANQSLFNNHGVTNPGQLLGVIANNKKSSLTNFYDTLINSERLKNLVKPLFTLEDYKGALERHTFECLKCNTPFEAHLQSGGIPRCLKCFPTFISFPEAEVPEWIQKLGITNIISKSKQIIAPYELDIYLPDYKLAIEFNGLYYHSESNGKDKNYHLNKTNLCRKKGIQLIHIFEDEWTKKREIVKSLIKNTLGLSDKIISISNCTIKEVSKKEVFNFLSENHLQKPIIVKHNFGLYYENKLVYLICIGNSSDGQYDVVRNCCLLDTSIPRGLNKLIKHALTLSEIKSLTIHVDKRYFNKNAYKNWNYLGDTDPDYFYMCSTNHGIRLPKQHYQKRKLLKLIPEAYDENLTEWENLFNAGYDRIWDCGNYIYKVEK